MNMKTTSKIKSVTPALVLLSVLFLGFTMLPIMGTNDIAPYSQDEDGKQLYMTRCMSCHQMNGQGISGVFPPLAGTEWVVGDKGRLIRIVLGGVAGEITVQDVVYSGAMPPWNTFLNDEQIAAILTYIRSDWGNKAGAVKPEEVAAIRAATADRTQAWTEAELEEEANMGIPGVEEEDNPFGIPTDSDG
jgi:mono/diheme cytochrome c family protein